MKLRSERQKDRKDELKNSRNPGAIHWLCFWLCLLLYVFVRKNLPDQLEKFKLAENQEYQTQLDQVLKEILSEIKFKSFKIIRHKTPRLRQPAPI